MGREKNTYPRCGILHYIPDTALRTRVCGAPEASREGRAVRGRCAFRAHLTRSMPTLRPTGTRTGLRLNVRRKSVRRRCAHQSDGEREDWRRKHRAGRCRSASFVFSTGALSAPRLPLIRGGTTTVQGPGWRRPRERWSVPCECRHCSNGQSSSPLPLALGALAVGEGSADVTAIAYLLHTKRRRDTSAVLSTRTKPGKSAKESPRRSSSD